MYHICENQKSDLITLPTIRQNVILNHWAYGVYSPTTAVTAAQSILPGPRIQNGKIVVGMDFYKTATMEKYL